MTIPSLRCLPVFIELQAHKITDILVDDTKRGLRILRKIVPRLPLQLQI